MREAAADRRDPLDPRPALERDRELYRRLGLVGWDESPVEVDWPALAGLYRPGEDRILLVHPASGPKRSAAHRVAVHLALLDGRVPLAARLRGDSADNELARQAFVLGDVLLSWLGRGASLPGELEARQRQAARELEGALLGGPPAPGAGFGQRYAMARLSFGLRALVALRARLPWGVVDELHGRGLPSTTSQLLHPELLLEAEPPRAIEAGPLPALAARGAPRSDVLGELRSRLWLERWLEPAVAARAAEGWAGDRYQLYGPSEAGAPWTSTLVLLSTFAIDSEGGSADAVDFEGALVEMLRARRFELTGAAVEGARTLVDDRGLSALVERRDEAVLYLEGAPADQAGALRDQAWAAFEPGRPHAGLSGPLSPPPAIAPLPPGLPWYRRTPGLVALALWLVVVLPLLGFAGLRLGRLDPVRVYLFGLVATLVLVGLGWLLEL